MTGDMSKVLKLNSYGGGIMRVGNNATCKINGMRSITLDGKTKTDEVYFFDGLKHNLLSLGQLVDKGYQLQFADKTCTFKDKEGNIVGTGTRSKGNVF